MERSSCSLWFSPQGSSPVGQQWPGSDDARRPRLAETATTPPHGGVKMGRDRRQRRRRAVAIGGAAVAAKKHHDAKEAQQQEAMAAQQAAPAEPVQAAPPA